MNNGWIKLHRKLVEWEWFKKSEMVHLFLYFMLLANHEEKKWSGQTIERGQFITGRFSLSENTGISEQTIRTCINKLKSTNEITTKSTNKYTIITITKYDDYQKDDKKSTNKLTYGLTNNQPTTNQQLTTNKNDKNDKNDKKDTAEPSSALIPQIIKSFEGINPACKRMYGNPNQRRACQDLIDTYGFEETLKIVSFLPKNNSTPYKPKANTPLQLWEKYQSIKDSWLQEVTLKTKKREVII